MRMCLGFQYRITKYAKSHWVKKKKKKHGEEKLHKPTMPLAKTITYYNIE